MKECKDTYVAVVDKYMLDGANAFTLKHKQKGHMHQWCHHNYYGAVMTSKCT